MPERRVAPQRPVISFDSIPKKRKRSWKWFSNAFYCFVSAVFIGVTIAMDETVENKRNDSHGNCTEENTKNHLCMFGFSISSAILVILVKRTILFLQEIVTGQKTPRYDGKLRMLFKACFGKLQCPMLIIFVFVLILKSWAISKGECACQWKSILIAIGVAPLLSNLLQLNTFSGVEISTIIEENRKGVGHTLALDYHFRHLHGISTDQNAPGRHYILIPSDCDTTIALRTLDHCISPIRSNLYSFDNGQNSLPEMSIEYATPLGTLLELEMDDKYFGFPNKKEITYETKMFYGTLMRKLSNCQNCRRKIVLIPYDVDQFLKKERLGDLLFRTVSQENLQPPEEPDNEPEPSESIWQSLWSSVRSFTQHYF